MGIMEYVSKRVFGLLDDSKEQAFIIRGVFVCIRCSGIHRSMGTHISKVKSVDLDMWTPEQMASIMKWGNARANLYWEAHLKSGHVPPDHKIESFIRSKYESRRWALDGPPPSDPSVLDQGVQEPVAEAQPAEQQVFASTSTPPPTLPSTRNPGPSRPAHTLLSTTLVTANRRAPSAASPPPVVPAPTQAAQPAPAPAAAPKPQDDLFSLDFHAPPMNAATTTAALAPKKATNDILSLYSSGNATQQPTAATGFGGMPGPNTAAQWGWGAPQATAPPSADPWGSFTSAPAQNQFGGMQAPVQAQPAQTSLFSQNVWAAPTAPAAQQSNNMFGTNAWATSTTTNTAAPGGSSDPFGSSFGTSAAAPTTTAKKDDVFGDLWGEFK
ncbi:hypothetical protein FRC03_008651 [Tulasnella sp. 419]|nr:hypothetical protein FRC03_008651 [Tulasnella sp. 419]